MVETKIHLFLGEQIITLSHAAHIKLNTTEHIKSHRFSLSGFQSFPSNFTTRWPALTFHSMAREAFRTLHAANKPAEDADEGKSDALALHSVCSVAQSQFFFLKDHGRDIPGIVLRR
jgi:hypothetical protein